MTDNDYLLAIDKLAKAYNKTLTKIIGSLNYNLDLNNPHTLAITRSAFKELEALRALTKKWGLKYIPSLYKYVQTDTEKWLKTVTGKKTLDLAAGFAVVNKQAIEALLVQPETGFLSATSTSINSVKNGLKRIHTQAKLLRSHQSMIHEIIATTGILEGQPVNVVRAELTEQLMSSKNVSDLGMLKNVNNLPKGHLLREMADMPFVKIPTISSSTGYRRLRLDRYVEMVTRTKMRQATTVARRNKLHEAGYDLIQINDKPAKIRDACNLYKGKVFALTKEAAAMHNVPSVAELPHGGVPFHPSCLHFEIPFIKEQLTKEEVRKAMKPPPAWALNKSFTAVNKIYKTSWL